MTAILSVERTGTHFVANLVEQISGKATTWAAPMCADWLADQPIAAIIQHVYPKGYSHHADALIGVMQSGRVIVPIRDPIKALISHHDNGAVLPLRDHARCWGRIQEILNEAQDFRLVQVDGPIDGRLKIAQSLGDFLGVSEKVDVHDIRRAKLVHPASAEPVVAWVPRNVTPSRRHSALRSFHADKEWDKLNQALDGAISILADHRDFFAPFGYEIP